MIHKLLIVTHTISIKIITIEYYNPLLRRPSSSSREEEEEDEKNCFNITQNLLDCSLSYPSTYIGTPKFFVKILWFYNDLK